MEKLLSKLIGFKTISDNYPENKKAISWVRSQLKGLPLQIKEFNFNKHPSLFITTKKTKKPKLLLAAHLDVVPADEQMFKPKIKNNKIYGRGVFDMKYAIACYIKLFQDLGQNLKNYDLGILITTDEEIGGFDGTGRFLELGYGAEVCFLPDSGNVWTLENEAKGVWHLKIESQGKSAHGSVPWQGTNAIENLVDYLNIVRDKFFCLGKKCKTPDHYHETLNIGKIEGGKATNIVPDFAQAQIDIRFTAKMSKPKLTKILNDAKKEFAGLKITNLIYADAYRLDPKNKYLKLFQSIAHKKYKLNLPLRFSHGSSDARFFMFKNIPTLVISPKGGGHHSNGEWLDLKDLTRFHEILHDFVAEVSRLK